MLPGHKDNDVTRSFTACLSQCHAYTNNTHARTRAHVLRVPPWIFDNPNWIPQLGARRWFSTVLALHRPRLSCKIVSPRPRSESYEFANLPIPRFVGNSRRPTSHANLSLVRFYEISRSDIGLKRGKMRIVTPSLKISKLRAENKRRMVCGVFQRVTGYFDR